MENLNNEMTIKSGGLLVPRHGFVEFVRSNPYRKKSKRWQRFETAKMTNHKTVETLNALSDMKPNTIGRWWLRGLITINKVGLIHDAKNHR